MGMNILDEILAATRTRLPSLAGRRREFELAADALAPTANLFAALRGPSIALIAEVKRRSPSSGPLDQRLDPVGLASAYQSGGAAAISVLTNEPYFGGSMADLAAVAHTVTVPTLCKDFIVDEVQLLEARVAGAAAALLIVRALTPMQLAHLIAFSSSIGLATLVEAHSAGEIAVAVDAGAKVVGVNSRDLDTLVIDRATAWKLIALVPPDRIAVAESGMATAADVAAAADAGADAVLIGSALVASGDPLGHARALSGVRRRGR